MSKITHGAIIFAEIPYTEYNPHQHHGKHYYIVLANPAACAHSPVVQCVPFRQTFAAGCQYKSRLKQIVFRREVLLWQNNSPYCRRTCSNRVSFVAP